LADNCLLRIERRCGSLVNNPIQALTTTGERFRRATADSRSGRKSSGRAFGRFHFRSLCPGAQPEAGLPTHTHTRVLIQAERNPRAGADEGQKKQRLRVQWRVLYMQNVMMMSRPSVEFGVVRVRQAARDRSATLARGWHGLAVHGDRPGICGFGRAEQAAWMSRSAYLMESGRRQRGFCVGCWNRIATDRLITTPCRPPPHLRHSPPLSAGVVSITPGRTKRWLK